MDLTLLRASRAGEVPVPVPDGFVFGHDPGWHVTGVSLGGMAELQNDSPCDACGRTLWRGDNVLGKGITQESAGGKIVGSFFSPTCISCFVEDRGGLYSAALAALVMEV